MMIPGQFPIVAYTFFIGDIQDLTSFVEWLLYYYCILFRIDLAKPDQPNQMEMGRKDDCKVHKLFLDPSGEHHSLTEMNDTKWCHVVVFMLQDRPHAKSFY